jgi:hypothetical protein
LDRKSRLLETSFDATERQRYKAPPYIEAALSGNGTMAITIRLPPAVALGASGAPTS